MSYICLGDECGRECNLIKDEIDYSGTHCTNGQGGTYWTGHYVSDCCMSDYQDDGTANEEYEEEVEEYERD